MPKTSRPPKHCIHKKNGKSYIRIDGRHIYTGTLADGKITLDAERKYRRILANQDKSTKPDSITIDELILYLFKRKLPSLRKSNRNHFKRLANVPTFLN
ncbi:hypothetical protein FACS1894170_10570 [Planctomycetales bacterium]|nr:hypothetical protein FACS1894170_10570 [Planctomycetales bacterium]